VGVLVSTDWHNFIEGAFVDQFCTSTQLLVRACKSFSAPFVLAFAVAPVSNLDTEGLTVAPVTESRSGTRRGRNTTDAQGDVVRYSCSFNLITEEVKLIPIRSGSGTLGGAS